MEQCTRGARQLPTEHIQLVMVIKKEGLKQAPLKVSYLSGETADESEDDILRRISVNRKVSNEMIHSVKCSRLWTDRAVIANRESMTSAKDRQRSVMYVLIPPDICEHV